MAERTHAPSYIERLAMNLERAQNRLERGISLAWKGETLIHLKGLAADARNELEAEQRRLLDPTAKLRY